MRFSRRLLIGTTFSALPLAFSEGLRLAAGVPFAWLDLTVRWLWVVGILLAARVGQPYALGARWVLPLAGIVIVGGGGLAWLVYAMSGANVVAWAALAGWYVFLLGLDKVFADGRTPWQRWGMRGALALAAGAIPIIADQIESHFAEEEFFIALQALTLSGFWLTLLIARDLLWRAKPARTQRGCVFNRSWLGVCLFLLVLVSVTFTVQSYRQSFYPLQAPTFEGISPTAPFLCGQVAPDAQTFDGQDVFRRLLARVQANPYKRAPEYGMLALGTGEQRWAQVFRASLLDEAKQGLFTDPTNSVKSVQYEAALRVYYFSKMRTVFPNLFSADEDEGIRRWFAAVNRRAWTVEWVDWMYAVAFSKSPEGLYENQENGAGLLAALEFSGLGAPELSPANQEYLARNPRGWAARFRNTDDALIYQPEWISNAFLQFLFTGQAVQRNIQLAFEWLLLQSPPAGVPLRYNHPDATSLAAIAYLGARVLGDARYIWSSGQAVAGLEATGGYLFAQPGVEQPLDLVGRSPTEGTCLLYGNSGLPNQMGPLAPDKIVFRDGWAQDSAYLLLNLRFTGWHRYKATDAITLLSASDPLVSEEMGGAPFAWLPVGRSLFRDKRIPRENLNGLLIERTGLSAVLYQLTGAGGPWAQDPPYYARVERFETSAEMDVGTIVLDGWRGWQHKRTVYFYHRGPVVVVDSARGPSGNRAALVWHVATKESQAQGGYIRLSNDGYSAEVVFIHRTGGQVQVESRQGVGLDAQVMYRALEDGSLDTVTLFLMRDWIGADARLVQDSGQAALEITKGEKRITVPLAFEMAR